MNPDREKFLSLKTAPARLNVQETAWCLVFSQHEIPILVSKGLLKPLGHPAQNAVKYFAATTVEAMERKKDADRAPGWCTHELEIAGSFGTRGNREIKPLANPPFACLPQGRLMNQESNRRINRFQSCLHPCTRNFLVQPGCRADAQHVYEQRGADPEQQKPEPGLMLFIADCFVLIHRGSTFQFPPISVATDRDQNHYGSGAGTGMWRGEKADRK